MNRGWSAAEKHAVWTAALLLSLLLPGLLSLEPPASPALMVPIAKAVDLPRYVLVVTPEDRRPIDWTPALRWTWMSGMAAIAGWWLLGFIRVTRLVASSREHSTYRGVAVRTCDALRVPAVAPGPVILLPPSASEWPKERLDLVLTHEWGHVRRWDLVWRLVGTVACCVYWFHPLAWWAAAQQRRESEMACDDRVIANETTAPVYADSLVAVAREASGHAAPAAVLAMAKPRELEGRLLAVLDPSRRRGGSGWVQAFGALMLGIALVSPLAAWQSPGVQMKGSVRDVVGVLPGAKVVLTEKSGGAVYKFESGPDGKYAVTGVPNGTYDVDVLQPGYARGALGTLALSGEKTLSLDVYLNIGSIHETVTVDGGPAPVGVTATPEGPTRLRVSGNVQSAKLVKKVNPIYPKEAKVAGVQGLVRMKAVVGKNGEILNLTLLAAPSPELARAAMDAVRQWTYQSTSLNGEPVEVQTIIDVNFTLLK
jgi:TonB family protein